MKKYLAGLITGLILATTSFAFAANPIKLIVGGKEIQSDVPPQVINGRTMVPARFLAESLGAKVEWDAANNAVVVTPGGLINDAPTVPTDLPPVGSGGTSSSSTNDAQGDWISLRELTDKYGVDVRMGDKFTLKKADKTIEFSAPKASSNGGVQIIQVTPELKAKIDKGRFYLSLQELKNIGFLPNQ